MIFKQTKYALLPSLLLIVCFFSCQQQDKHRQIDAVIKDFHTQGAFNGAILVAQNGTIVYDTVIGLADFTTKKDLQPDSPFYLASISKQFTAMGIMLLAQKQLLNYDDPVSKYLPELPEYAKSITIRNLLNHTSGLKDYFESPGLIKPGLTNQQVFHWLQNEKKLNFAPGEKYEYSNTGYLLLSLIIEKVSSKPFALFMKESIFDPLKMEHTQVFEANTTAIKNRAAGFDKNSKPDDYNILTTGDGGIFATTHDLFIWDQALSSNRLLKDTVLEEAFTKPRLNNGTYSDYGFGWNIIEDDTKKVVFHTGGLNGYRTMIWRDLDKKITIILLTNNGDALQMWPVTNAVLAIMGGKKYVE